MYKIFESITEIIGWVQIVLSPTLIGLGAGFIIYYNFESPFDLVCGIVFSIIGLIFGIVLATKKFKTTGTINFLSRVSATPDLDENKMTESKNSH